MEVTKMSKVEVRDETLWAIKEALDNSDGFVIHISWLTSDGIVRHYNSQRDFLIEDLHSVVKNVVTFVDTTLESQKEPQPRHTTSAKRRG